MRFIYEVLEYSDLDLIFLLVQNNEKKEHCYITMMKHFDGAQGHS